MPWSGCAVNHIRTGISRLKAFSAIRTPKVLYIMHAKRAALAKAYSGIDYYYHTHIYIYIYGNLLLKRTRVHIELNSCNISVRRTRSKDIVIISLWLKYIHIAVFIWQDLSKNIRKKMSGKKYRKNKKNS